MKVQTFIWLLIVIVSTLFCVPSQTQETNRQGKINTILMLAKLRTKPSPTDDTGEWLKDNARTFKSLGPESSTLLVELLGSDTTLSQDVLIEMLGNALSYYPIKDERSYLQVVERFAKSDLPKEMYSALLFLDRYGDANSALVALEVLPNTHGELGASLAVSVAVNKGDERAIARLNRLKKDSTLNERFSYPNVKRLIDVAGVESEKRSRK